MKDFESVIQMFFPHKVEECAPGLYSKYRDKVSKKNPLYRVPFGHFPLLLETSELSPVVYRREEFPQKKHGQTNEHYCAYHSEHDT